jgi:hypothetical protein
MPGWIGAMYLILAQIITVQAVMAMGAGFGRWLNAHPVCIGLFSILWFTGLVFRDQWVSRVPVWLRIPKTSGQRIDEVYAHVRTHIGAHLGSANTFATLHATVNGLISETQTYGKAISWLVILFHEAETLEWQWNDFLRVNSNRQYLAVSQPVGAFKAGLWKTDRLGWGPRDILEFTDKWSSALICHLKIARIEIVCKLKDNTVFEDDSALLDLITNNAPQDIDYSQVLKLHRERIGALLYSYAASFSDRVVNATNS